MTDRYLLLMSEYASRDGAYLLLAAFGSGLVLSALAIHFAFKTFVHERLAAAAVTLFTGGILILYLAGLAILPWLKLD